jgi:hypothetical protein
MDEVITPFTLVDRRKRDSAKAPLYRTRDMRIPVSAKLPFQNWITLRLLSEHRIDELNEIRIHASDQLTQLL